MNQGLLVLHSASKHGERLGSLVASERCRAGYANARHLQEDIQMPWWTERLVHVC